MIETALNLMEYRIPTHVLKALLTVRLCLTANVLG